MKSNMKTNKIKVVVAPDMDERRTALAKLAIGARFALTISDAKKIIRSDLLTGDFCSAYFILCDQYSFRGSTYSTQKLFELAARGMFVAVGVKSLPREYQFLCDIFTP